MVDEHLNTHKYEYTRRETATITVGDFTIPLSVIDGSDRKKVSMETLNLNYTLDQMNPTNNIENILSNSSTIDILLTCQNILQNTVYVRS